MVEEPFTRAADVLTSTMVLPSGGYKFKVWYNGYGWAVVNGQLNVSPTGVYSVSPTASSFAGGVLTVTGSDISPSGTISIGGFSGKVLSQASGVTTFEIPALITPETIVWYPTLRNVDKIVPQAVISDGGSNPENIIDTQHHT